MRENKVKEYFDTHSEEYKPNYIKSQWEAKAEYIRGNLDNGRFLDVGCGSGEFLDYISADSNVELYGIDISSKMLPENSIGEEEYIIGSATDLPIKSESFDVIHMDAVLHHIVGETRSASKSRIESTLAKCIEALKPDGQLIVSELYYEGRIIPQSASLIIFYALNYAPQLSSIFDPDAISGLSVCFYTRNELESIIEKAGGEIINTNTRRWERKTPLRRMLIKDHGDVHLYIKKN